MPNRQKMKCYHQTALVLALVSNLDDSEWNIYNSLCKALKSFDHAVASLAYILTIVWMYWYTCDENFGNFSFQLSIPKYEKTRRDGWPCD